MIFLYVKLVLFLFQVDEIYKEAPISNGMFNYIEFAHNLKHGTKQQVRRCDSRNRPLKLNCFIFHHASELYTKLNNTIVKLMKFIVIDTLNEYSEYSMSSEIFKYLN